MSDTTKWTTDLPTVAGWYKKRGGICGPSERLVKVVMYETGPFSLDKYGPLKIVPDGEWCGPLEQVDTHTERG